MANEFNFKSQICTTVEQSKRLLGLGLKPETADCHWAYHSVTATRYVVAHPCDGVGECIPAWGLHRLIEMMPENVSDDWLGVSFDEISYYHGECKDMIGWKYYKAGNLYDCIIECYKWLIKEGYFNKEYLEE